MLLLAVMKFESTHPELAFYALLGPWHTRIRLWSTARNAPPSPRLHPADGQDSPRYLLAQVVYAEALESAGMHAEAVRTKREAEGKLRVFYREQCAQCRITSMALH